MENKDFKNEHNFNSAQYRNEYSDETFWTKVSRYARRIGKKLLYEILKLYFTMISEQTPIWAKGIIVAALGYFISPIDAIPDVIPVIGYSDDAGVIAAAIAAVAAYISEEIIKLAENKIKEWFR